MVQCRERSLKEISLFPSPSLPRDWFAFLKGKIETWFSELVEPAKSWLAGPADSPLCEAPVILLPSLRDTEPWLSLASVCTLCSHLIPVPAGLCAGLR